MIGFVWAVWAVSLAATAVFGQTAALRYMILLLPFCIAASSLATFLAARRIAFSISIKQSGTKHQGIKGELTVKNNGILPLVQLRCVMQIKNLLTGESFEQPASFSVKPFDSRSFNFTINSKHCGHLRISFKKVLAIDYFGITRFRKKFSKSYDAIVSPEGFEIRVIPSSEYYSPEESEEYVPNKAGSDVSEVHQIRAYRPGDSLRQIHWKLTAKADEIMVKEAGEPLKYNMLLFLDLSRPDGTEGSPACYDALAETAVSLSEGLLDAGLAHMLVWRQSDGSVANRTIKDSDTLAEMLPELLAGQEQFLTEKEERRSNLLEGINASNIIWLCYNEPIPYFDTEAHVTAICCVKSSKKDRKSGLADTVWITPKTYKQDIADIII